MTSQNIQPIFIPRWRAAFARRETFVKYEYHFGKKNTFVSKQAFRRYRLPRRF